MSLSRATRLCCASDAILVPTTAPEQTNSQSGMPAGVNESLWALQCVCEHPAARLANWWPRHKPKFTGNWYCPSTTLGRRLTLFASGYAGVVGALARQFAHFRSTYAEGVVGLSRRGRSVLPRIHGEAHEIAWLRCRSFSIGSPFPRIASSRRNRLPDR